MCPWPSRSEAHAIDGLTPEGVNENQGAESTLMWLIALERIRTIRGVHAEAPTRTEALAVAVAR